MQIYRESSLTDLAICRVAVNLARNVERNGGNAMDLIGMIPTDSICKTEKDYGRTLNQHAFYAL